MWTPERSRRLTACGHERSRGARRRHVDRQLKRPAAQPLPLDACSGSPGVDAS
jgi:hypothetical protein